MHYCGFYNQLAVSGMHRFICIFIALMLRICFRWRLDGIDSMEVNEVTLFLLRSTCSFPPVPVCRIELQVQL